jgi:DNA polymerase-3 subunit delta'
VISFKDESLDLKGKENLVWSIIGQNKAVSLLQRGLETGSLAHAYIFIGPAHIGKMTLALNLAQALNCEADKPPCGQCDSCQKIASAKHADVQIIDLSHSSDLNESRPRAEISIDQIRQIQHSASLPPFEGKYKVFIINETEFLSLEAANSLLKTLEEPIGKVVYILLTTSGRLLPATVVSRCQKVELLPMPVSEIETSLVNNWGMATEKARLLARLSHGCLGWAVSVALDDKLLNQRAEWLDRLFDIIDADCDERFTYSAKLAEQFSQNRGLVYERLNLWLDLWRDLLLIKVGLFDGITNIDRLDSLSDMAKGHSLTQIRGFIRSIQAASEQLRKNASPRLVLDVLMLDIPEAKRDGEISLPKLR